MVCVARVESGLNPSAVNPTSGALGLFQHMPQYWGGRAAALGYGYESWSDPVANARVSAKLLAEGGPGHWAGSGC
jgi:soluble lytic murein transglycosylase-like protein